MGRDVGGASRLYLKTLFEDGVQGGHTDGQLLEQFATSRQDAAERAFTALVERHGPMVFRACRAILRDDHEAMDAFQATFLVLVRKGRSLWVRDSLGPWLHRVACRAARRSRAQAGRRQALLLAAAGTEREPSARVEYGELSAAVHEELNRLPDRYRVPIVLCDLEGRTCEEAARHLGCPIGTIGSRLSRGRERLRGRLARRGLAPAIGGLTAALATDLQAASTRALLRSSAAEVVRFAAASTTGIGASSAGSAKLAEDVLRSMLMVRFASVGSALALSTVVCLGSAWALRAVAGGQAAGQARAKAAVADAKATKQDEIARDYPFLNDKERVKNALYVEIGNMRPLINDARGVRFQTREGIVYKDGTARLWSPAQKEPVAPPFRHDGPIRELTFFDEAGLLVTRSDDSIKIWDALTGAPRKEFAGQTLSPMWLTFAPGGKRFVTYERGGKAVTVWDTEKLTAVNTIVPPGDAGAAVGLSRDGKTVVRFLFGTEPTVELWDVASGRSFATLRLPSPAVAEAFTAQGKDLNKEYVHRDGRFWDFVRSLAPLKPSS